MTINLVFLSFCHSKSKYSSAQGAAHAHLIESDGCVMAATPLPHSRSEPSDLESIEDHDFSEEIPRAEGRVISFLISQIRPGMSLARLTLPTFVLATRSALERLTDWMIQADILRLINTEDNRYYRALHICTWIVAGFHQGPRTPKKQYNSQLGECFRAALRDHDWRMIRTYIAEEVSHHPPICAVHYQDREGGVVIWGHLELQSKFFGDVRRPVMDNDNSRLNFRGLTWAGSGLPVGSFAAHGRFRSCSITILRKDSMV
jgi:hypothetical protein